MGIKTYEMFLSRNSITRQRRDRHETHRNAPGLCPGGPAGPDLLSVAGGPDPLHPRRLGLGAGPGHPPPGHRRHQQPVRREPGGGPPHPVRPAEDPGHGAGLHPAPPGGGGAGGGLSPAAPGQGTGREGEAGPLPSGQRPLPGHPHRHLGPDLRLGGGVLQLRGVGASPAGLSGSPPPAHRGGEETGPGRGPGLAALSALRGGPPALFGEPVGLGGAGGGGLSGPGDRFPQNAA